MIISATGLALPRLAEELGLTSVQQGSLVSIQFIGFTIAALIGGTLADRFGKLKILRAAFLGLGIATFVFGAAFEFWMTVVGVFFIGAFGGAAQNAITALTTSYDSRRVEANNVFVQIFFTVGAILTPLLLLFFMIQLNRWRYAYYFVATLSIIMVFITTRYKNEDQKRASSIKEAFSQYKKVFKNPTYLIAPIALFLYVAAEIGVWGFAPMFFENQGYGKISGILSSVLIWVSMFAGRALAVRLLKKFNMSKIMFVFGILAIASLSLVIFSNRSTAILWIGVAGFACAPFYPMLVAWMTKLTGEKSSTMLALIMAMGAFGAVAMGWVIGLIVDSFGSRYITIAPAGSFVLLVILIFIFRNKKAENIGVTPSTIRLSVGIEDVDDLIYDIDQALEKSSKN